jgi:hypothetical protein
MPDFSMLLSGIPALFPLTDMSILFYGCLTLLSIGLIILVWKLKYELGGGHRERGYAIRRPFGRPHRSRRLR